MSTENIEIENDNIASTSEIVEGIVALDTSELETKKISPTSETVDPGSDPKSKNPIDPEKRFEILCKVLEEERVKYLKRFSNVEQCLNKCVDWINLEMNNRIKNDAIQRENIRKSDKRLKKIRKGHRKMEEENRKWKANNKKILKENSQRKIDEYMNKSWIHKVNKFIFFGQLFIQSILILSYFLFKTESLSIVLFYFSSYPLTHSSVFCLYILFLLYLSVNKTDWLDNFSTTISNFDTLNKSNIYVHGFYSPGKIISTTIWIINDENFTVNSNLVADKPFIVTIKNMDNNNEVFKFEAKVAINDIFPMKYQCIVENLIVPRETEGSYTISIETYPETSENIKFENTYFSVKH